MPGRIVWSGSSILILESESGYLMMDQPFYAFNVLKERGTWWLQRIYIAQKPSVATLLV